MLSSDLYFKSRIHPAPFTKPATKSGSGCHSRWKWRCLGVWLDDVGDKPDQKLVGHRPGVSFFSFLSWYWVPPGSLTYSLWKITIPKENYSLSTIIFQWRTVKLPGCSKYLFMAIQWIFSMKPAKIIPTINIPIFVNKDCWNSKST